MEFKDPFIIYRLTGESQVKEVFHTRELKRAKYWLAYIAQAGDVLCKTPAHPKHSKRTKRPEYWSHKESSGHSCSDEKSWMKFANSHNFVEFPEEQLETSESDYRLGAERNSTAAADGGEHV